MRVLVWFGTSDVARHIYALASALLLPGGILLQEASLRFDYIPSRPDIYFGMIVVGFGWIIIHLCATVLFRRFFTMNRLYYEKATGVLYDQWLREHNVALRRDTVRQLVGAIVENGAPPRQPRQRSDIQFEVGCRIGREFHDVFRERSKKGGARDSGKPFLERMLAYDSSSGMGQFDLVEYNAETPRIKIVVKNAFTQLHVGDPVSEFLKGYLVGMCSEVVGHQLRVDGQALREPSAVELVFHK